MFEDYQVSEQILPMGYLLSGRYVLNAFLGSGGMGAVYLACDRLLEDKQVAIKILHKEFSRDSELTRRFLREVNMMHSVNHPNVVRTFDAGVEDGMFYFTMEYIEGSLLDKYLESLGCDYNLLGKVTAQICKGLEAIHTQNIVHRDLKPGNILVSNDGVVKITDFGVARPVSTGHTAHREVMGSLDYIPPEVFQGHQILPASDFYSLGVILYGIVCGVFPFEAEDPMAIVWKHVNEVPQLPSNHNPEVPAWMDRLIMRLLEKDPAKRPQTAREIVRFVRSNIHRDSKILDSGNYKIEVAESQYQSFDTDIFEMDLEPSDLEQNEFDDSSMNSVAPILSAGFSNAFNQLIFDPLPTVDQIKRHEEMWDERRRKRDESHNLKGLAAKVKQAEKYIGIKKIRLAIYVVGFVVILSVILAFVDGKTSGSSEEVSIGDLKKEYLFGQADIPRNVKIKSERNLPNTQNYFWQFQNLFNGNSQVSASQLKDLSSNRGQADQQNLNNLEERSLNSQPRSVQSQPAQIRGDRAPTSEQCSTSSIQLLQRRSAKNRQQLQNAIRSHPVISNVYQEYQSTSLQGSETASQLREPTSEQRNLYFQKKKLRENLNSLQGELNAYLIADDSELARKELESAQEAEKIKKLQSMVESYLSTELERRKVWSSLVVDLDKGGYIKVAKKLSKVDANVQSSLELYQKSEQANNEMMDSIKDVKLVVDKIAVAEVARELEKQRDELNKVLRKSINQALNSGFKELLNGGVLFELVNEQKAAVNTLSEARRNYWLKLQAGQAEKKNILEAKKQELEKRLSEAEKSLSTNEETSIRGLVAVKSFRSNSK